ncbi:MAG: metal ABC transporter ATP-binding protein [Cloacibacillus evryensis]
MPAFVCSGLSVAYGGREALSDIDFELPRGAFLAIVGENGSGKSTLIKALLGLIKPSAGTVRLGEGLKTSDIGYLPQQREARSDFPATVYEIALSGRLNKLGLRPFYGRRDRRCAEESLRLMGLWELRTKAFRELSGGQQQRTLLARALCASGGLLLLDEPDGMTRRRRADVFCRIVNGDSNRDRSDPTLRAATAIYWPWRAKYFGESCRWPANRKDRMIRNKWNTLLQFSARRLVGLVVSLCSRCRGQPRPKRTRWSATGFSCGFGALAAAVIELSPVGDPVVVAAAVLLRLTDGSIKETPR